MKYAKMKETALDQYYTEYEKLGHTRVQEILEAGKQWNLAPTLRSGGSAIFPHTFLSECGSQIAAVVHGCLDSGADQVLVLGVVHPLNEDQMMLRMKEINQESLDDEPTRGVFETVDGEFSLYHFKKLFEIEVRNRGIKPLKLIERYPCLTNRRPENLPGIEELKAVAKDSIVIATSDLCHYGAAYGHQNATYEETQAFAIRNINLGFSILQTGDYVQYFNHCLASLSDSLDTCTVLSYLQGTLSANILDFKLVDVSSLFIDDPKPSWVAASLVEMQKQI